MDIDYELERKTGLKMLPLHVLSVLLWLSHATIAIIAYIMNNDIPCNVDNPGVTELDILIYEFVAIPITFICITLWYLFLFTDNNFAFKTIMMQCCFIIPNIVFMVYALIIFANKEYQCPNYRLIDVYIIIRYIVSPIYNFVYSIINYVVKHDMQTK